MNTSMLHLSAFSSKRSYRTDHKARTLAATVANVFAAKHRHDTLVDASLARTARENPQDAGNILWLV